ncbi:MAG: DUF2304 domain-containing protein [Firmicutes bacterium]|nr:DUF2304 domain-containing protein [Bacillota bacterium]
MNRVAGLVTLLGLAFGWTVIQAMRRRKLSERDGLPWLGLSVVLIAAPLLRQPLDRVAAWLGVHYAPAIWLLVGMIGLFFICFRLTMVVTDLQARVVRLTQELALMKQEDKAP